MECWLVEGLEFSLHSVAGEGLLRRCLWVEALKDVRPENGAESQKNWAPGRAQPPSCDYSQVPVSLCDSVSSFVK